jgi:hypothetical protein
MKSIWKMLTIDWKPVLIIWLPIFAAAMWYGIAHHYDDMVLYTIAMALAAWAVAGRAVFLYRKLQECRVSTQRDSDA